MAEYSGTTLPRYLARHMKLGFDSDDVAALIGSINSSQTPEPSPFPHLPAEVIFVILECIPIHYILPCRLICRAVRDYIDGPICFQYLNRAQLIGYLGPQYDSADQREKMSYPRAHFDRLDEMPKVERSGGERVAKWSGTRAIFKIEEKWMELYNRVHQLTMTLAQDKTPWLDLVEKLKVRRDEDSYGTIRWCLQLDQAVLELDYPVEALRDSFTVDLTNGTIVVYWKRLLLRFLKTEALFQKTVEAKKDGMFTFTHEDDCLRAVRRGRLCGALNMDDAVHRRIKWEMNLLSPLFGEPCRDKPAFDNLEDVEINAVYVLKFLRREASLSKKELAYLQQLAADRKEMDADLDRLTLMFAQWKGELFDSSLRAWPGARELSSLPHNPIRWNDKTVKEEDARVKKWRTQKRTLDQLSTVLGCSMEAMSIPEDAFDDLGRDL